MLRRFVSQTKTPAASAGGYRLLFLIGSFGSRLQCHAPL